MTCKDVDTKNRPLREVYDYEQRVTDGAQTDSIKFITDSFKYTLEADLADNVRDFSLWYADFARERPVEWLRLYRNHKSLCIRLMSSHFGAEIGRLSDVGEKLLRAKDWATYTELQDEARKVLDEALSSVFAEPITDFATSDIDPDKLQQDTRNSDWPHSRVKQNAFWKCG